MSYRAAVFLVIAFVAAIFGFGGTATTASIAKIICIIFIALCIAAALFALAEARRGSV